MRARRRPDSDRITHATWITAIASQNPLASQRAAMSTESVRIYCRFWYEQCMTRAPTTPGITRDRSTDRRLRNRALQAWRRAGVQLPRAPVPLPLLWSPWYAHLTAPRPCDRQSSRYLLETHVRRSLARLVSPHLVVSVLRSTRAAVRPPRRAQHARHPPASAELPLWNAVDRISLRLDPADAQQWGDSIPSGCVPTATPGPPGLQTRAPCSADPHGRTPQQARVTAPRTPCVDLPASRHLEILVRTRTEDLAPCACW